MSTSNKNNLIKAIRIQGEDGGGPASDLIAQWTMENQDGELFVTDDVKAFNQYMAIGSEILGENRSFNQYMTIGPEIYGDNRPFNQYLGFEFTSDNP